MTTTDLRCAGCRQHPRLPGSSSCYDCRLGQVEADRQFMREHGFEPGYGGCPLSPNDRGCPAGVHQPESCDMCGRQDVPHYASHWNGAFQQCENCAQLEALDPGQNALDPIFGGTFGQGMAPVYAPGVIR